MKKNWTFAAIALILAVAAVVVAFIAGKKFTEDPDQDPEDEDLDQDPDDKPEKNDDQDGKD